MNKYWENRFIQLEKASIKYGQRVYNQIERVFYDAEMQLQKEIDAWYIRLAKNNNITMAEAKKLLSKRELEEFKWDVNKYISAGRENALNQRWLKQLENASAKMHINRLTSIKLRLQHIAEVCYGNQLDLIDTMATDIFRENYYDTLYELQKGFNIGFNIAELDEAYIKKIVSKPWASDGVNFSNRIWKNKDKLIEDLHIELTRNILLGESSDKLINKISKRFSTSKSNASRLVMTELAFFHTVSQAEAFKDFGCKKYEISAVLDNKTSPICQDFDGKVFMVADMEIGVNAPPLHPRCRSVVIPYYDDYGEGTRIARNDKDTYYVPSNMTYKEWKNKYVGNKNSNNWIGLNYDNPYDKQSAIDRLKNKYNIDFRDSRKYPIDGELLSDCVAWMDAFSNEYEGFISKNPCQIPIIEILPPSKMRRALGSYRYYESSPKVAGLCLNGLYHNDVEMFKEYIANSVKNKWSVANSALRTTFVHEIGHHISNSMRWVTNDPNWEHKFIRDCLLEFKKAEPEYKYESHIFIGDYVSDYAQESESELFAEAFAEYFGGENPRKFAQIFGNKLDKLLREVK